MQLIINTFGSYLQKKGDCFRIKTDQKKTEVSCKKISSILITTAAYITTDAVKLAVDNNIDIVFLDEFGDPYGRIWHPKIGSTTLIRRKQLEIAELHEGLALSVNWIKTKLINQIDLLKDLRKKRPQKSAEITDFITKIESILDKLNKLDGNLEDQRATQCKLELLMHPPGRNIEYLIFIAGYEANEQLGSLEQKLQTGDFGYGVYFGQRQFKADIEYINSFKKREIQFKEESEYLDSICAEENCLDIELNNNVDIWAEQMSVDFKQVKEKHGKGREPTVVKRVYFERNGRRLKGKFKNCYKVSNQFISFY